MILNRPRGDLASPVQPGLRTLPTAQPLGSWPSLRPDVQADARVVDAQPGGPPPSPWQLGPLPISHALDHAMSAAYDATQARLVSGLASMHWPAHLCELRWQTVREKRPEHVRASTGGLYGEPSVLLQVRITAYLAALTHCRKAAMFARLGTSCCSLPRRVFALPVGRVMRPACRGGDFFWPRSGTNARGSVGGCMARVPRARVRFTGGGPCNTPWRVFGRGRSRRQWEDHLAASDCWAGPPDARANPAGRTSG